MNRVVMKVFPLHRSITLRWNWYMKGLETLNGPKSAVLMLEAQYCFG